jgi:uncharacterized protein involved in type VI secretion and phage assembly
VNLLDVMMDRTVYEGHTGKIYGVVVGIVTNNKDPDNLGRVKIRFPWLSDNDESHWARVATLMAGNDRGSFFLPEVDDEVLVAFDHGDVRFPYVIGALWNGVDKSPYNNANGKNNLRAIKSRSGHELIFDDSQAGEKVELHTQAGHQIILDDASGREKITITDKSGNNQIEIDAMQNAISVTSQLKLSLKAQTIEIEAGTMLTIKAGATLTIQGGLVKIN